MVENGLRVETWSSWFPTRASADRAVLMDLEFSLNQIPKGDELSIAETAWATGDVNQALAVLPDMVPSRIRREMRRLLRPWPAGRYTTAYRRSGGILNLFTPPWGEEQDELWANLLAERGAESLAELAERWNETPHPFFAGLTPAQVMVGGGPQEAGISREFRRHLTRLFDGRPFESEGHSLQQTLMLLRGWQCQQGADGRTPFEIISAERDELLARRERILSRRDA
jgi:hypothetical protein